MPPGSSELEVWKTPVQPSNARHKLSMSVMSAITADTPPHKVSVSLSLSQSSASFHAKLVIICEEVCQSIY